MISRTIGCWLLIILTTIIYCVSCHKSSNNNENDASVTKDAGKNNKNDASFDANMDADADADADADTDTDSDTDSDSDADADPTCCVHLDWVRSAGSKGYYDHAYDMALLPDDSVVIAGGFSDRADFEDEHIDSKGYSDNFISRYDSDGDLVWVKSAGGTTVDNIKAITRSSNNTLVVSGQYGISAIFGENESNETTLVAEDGRDIFLAKYDCDGGLIWAKSAGADNTSTTSGDSAEDVVTLADNSIIVVGYFANNAIFGKNEANETTIESLGETDIFIARYNTNGQLEWVKNSGGDTWDYAYSVDVLPDNTIVVVGYFEGTITLGSGETNETTLVSQHAAATFVSQFNTDGTLILAFSENYRGSDIYITDNGSSLIAGYFSDTLTIGEESGNEIELVSAGGSDNLFAVYENDWSVSWAKAIGGSGSEGGLVKVTANANNSIYFLAGARPPVTIEEGEPEEIIFNNSDMFVANYNTNGKLNWARAVCNGCSANSISVTDNGVIFIAGYYYDAVFGPGDPNEQHLEIDYSDDDYDIFLAKFSP